MAQKSWKAPSNVNKPWANSKSGQPMSQRQKVVQNFRLVWVDANNVTTSEDSQNTLQKLRRVVNDISHFSDPEECVTFLEDVHTEKAFVITSGSLGQDIVPLIHPMAHVDTIYIFCGGQRQHEEWTKEWSKIMGVHTRIGPICEALQLAVKQCNQDSIAISFPELPEEGTSSTNLDRLEPSFMCTQLFKKALLDMPHKQKEAQELVRYCEDKYAGNTYELALIREFGCDYHPEKAIWWYTRQCFTYQMLNRSLRLLDADIIVNVGFFIHDLHRQIEQMHAEQVHRYAGQPFLVYRGQGLSIDDFEKLKSGKGLISFNSFLSTSQNKEISLAFARSALTNDNMVGVLFLMTVDPKLTLTPFADIQERSYFHAEVEILFAMHAVFRMASITAIGDQERLFEVHLTLTSDDDLQLRTLTERFDAEAQGSTGWDRLGRILIQVGNSKKARELYETLLSHPSNQGEEALYNQQLGTIKWNQGEYQEALSFYEKDLDIRQKSLPANHPSLATSYNNIGNVYNSMGEYTEALPFYEKALNIYQKSLPANHPSLATSYTSTGLAYCYRGEYWKALPFYEKALSIDQKSLPANHPSLATSYNNIGSVYDSMGEYSKALHFYEKALEIRQKSLPANHPSLATSYNNIGSVYGSMGEYSKALSVYEKALDIYQTTLPANHPRLKVVRESIVRVKNRLLKK